MDTVLSPLLYLVSWIMIGWHWLFDTLIGIGHDGVNWTLSIIGLVIVIRTLLIPLFVRQIRSQRKMQVLQPQLRELQKKYKGDRERLQQETMKLYKDSGTNPFASCLPILLQAPFLFALFRVLDGIANDDPRGAFTNHQGLFESAGSAQIFGAPLADSFLSTDVLNTRIIAAVMVVLMVASQFITQRQIMRKNMPKESLEGPFAQQQKVLLYVLPLVFAFSGVYFPLGTVLYWLTSNIWTMAQQLYVIRRMPAPGTEAEQAQQRRREAKAKRKGQPIEAPAEEAKEQVEVPPQVVRQQPKKTTRSQRKKK
ncbi:YidC/Oxa1 family membrane protein insertase [Haloactinopolyspora alba]|uniref:Membrane protein insertase YidC n=1 Tax=Haloactinopolyspora alba TaxID=648780 RepID=A0A2P8DW04_9ACTN|nr:membrane protein insertase YidC [Haloactinopolyspora alba]PSL01396.1 YidC/Oxa1 family membrane protein insertase [Haloactinopolyspora alba]